MIWKMNQIPGRGDESQTNPKVYFILNNFKFYFLLNTREEMNGLRSMGHILLVLDHFFKHLE